MTGELSRDFLKATEPCFNWLNSVWFVKERLCGNCVAQQVRMNFFSDAGTSRRFFDNLLNSAGGEFRVAIAFKNI